MKTIAVVLASGSGTRFDKNIIKQYQTINDHSAVYYSVLALKKNINISHCISCNHRIISGDHFL